MRSLKNSVSYAMICLTVALALAGCSRKTIYSHYEHTPINGWGWEQSDTLYFSLPPIKSGGVMTGEVGLRNTTAYPYQELSVIVCLQVIPSGFQRNDTICFKMADGEGNYQGNGMNLFQHNMPLPDLLLNDGDSLHVSIYHCMKRENLSGIADIGFTLRKK